MAQTSFALLTSTGRAKEAAALANATAIEITEIAIGDGATVPSGGEVKLYNQLVRKKISGHGVVAGASNVAYFDCYLAANEGPYTIREAGLYDAEGDLIAIAHYDPPINKPIPASGQTVEGTIRLEVAFSDLANITIKVDPTMQVALQRLARLPWLSIISMTDTSPPQYPAVGDVYLIPPGATGSWAGQAGRIAEFTQAGWAMMTPPNGHGISLPDGRVFEKINGAYVEKLARDVQSGKWTYATATGSANALTAALNPVPTAYAEGMAIAVKVAANNTGPAAINLNGLGSKNIVRSDGSPLQAGDLMAGEIAKLVYANGQFQIEGLATARTLLRNTWARSTNGTYTFTVPAGVTRMYCICVGGGGGGGGAGSAGGASGTVPAIPGGGGGAGGTAAGWINVRPGEIIPIYVGYGGVGGAYSHVMPDDGDGDLGSTSSIGSYMSATGGGGGGGYPNATNGGRGGIGVGGQINLVGGMGSDGGGSIGTNLYGGCGGASNMGGGGRAVINQRGIDGQAPGSGGGSAYGTWSHDMNGGFGADGIVILHY